MRSISLRQFAIGFLLLIWAIWSLASESPDVEVGNTATGAAQEIGLVE